MTPDEDVWPEGFRPATHDDFNTLEQWPEGYRPITQDDVLRFNTPKPTVEDSLRTSLPGAMLQGAVRLGQGAEQLAAHGVAAAADLLPTYPVKGAGTGQPAPHTLSSTMHGFANYADEAIASQNRGYEEAGQRADAASSNPRLSMALRRTNEFAGASAFPGVGEVLPEVQALGTLGNAALRSGAGGAAYGALQPVLDKPKSERDYWITKAKQTGTGGLTGAVLGSAAEMLSTVRGSVPTSGFYNDLKRDAYEAAEATNATVPKAGLISALNNSVAIAHREATYYPELAPKAATAIETMFRQLDELPPEISFRDIDVVRRIARTVLKKGDDHEREVAQVLIHGIDDYVRGLNAPEGSLLFDARSLATRAFKLEAVEDAMDKAENATGSGSFIPAGANQSRTKLDNAVRQQFAKLVNNPRTARQFNAAERQIMRDIAHGTTTQNVARLLGKLSPNQTIPIVSELNAIGTALFTGHPLYAGGVAAGAFGAAVSQHVADTIGQGQVDRLRNVIATGRPGAINVQRPPPPGFYNGGQYVQNGHVYMMVNGVMVPQMRLEQ